MFSLAPLRVAASLLAVTASAQTAKPTEIKIGITPN